LRGERSKITYNIGDELNIEVSEVDIDMRRITFILADK
jgi:exoribonuclease R